jgi:lysozyme family protein
MQTSPQFEACLPFTLTEEGGNSNDAHDPGGRTHKGIIQREYDRYRRSKGLPLQSDYAMSDDEVREIYWTEYWLPHCPSLAPGVDLSFFDNAVNEGPYRAIVLMQRALGITSDGIWGDKTTEAVQRIGNVPAFIMLYSQSRAQFYKGLRTFAYFGKGWMARVVYIQNASLEMAEAGASQKGPQA